MTFEEIRNNNLSDLSFLYENDKYYAHTAKISTQKNETLEEHLKLVEYYFLKIVTLNHIEFVVDKLIDKFTQPFSNNNIKNFTKALFYNSIIYHDFGKINHLFQYEKMDNRDKRIKERKHNESTHHSSLSAYLFLVHQFSNSDNFNFNAEEQTLVDFITTCFSYPIYKHHSSYLSKIESASAYSRSNIDYLKDFLGEFDFEIKDEDLDIFHNMINDMETTINQIFESDKKFDFFSLFALLKLNYSLLTASDYLATSDYMNGLKLETKTHFGILTDEFKKTLIENFDNNEKKTYNGKLIREWQFYANENEENYRIKSNDNLNFLRQKMGAEVLQNIEKHKNEKVFYIEAPTGGGKTNMSMVAIRKMLELHPEINKIFYVFPFTTLVTQTAKAIKETFGLGDSDVAQLHSKSGFQQKDYTNETDAKYGTEKRNQIDNLFVNYPFTLLTHIKFFDILKSNKKDTNYLLHRLANSIVIIDELQAYNPSEWDKIKYFIAKYAELFNIRFVIMSATLPKIDEIELSGNQLKPFISLIPNAKKYLQNPNFAGRVKIKTDLLSKKIELNELADFLFEKSKHYSENRADKFKGSVYTVIEFILKKSASEFHDIVIEKKKFFDKIFVLSGTILEPRRKYIIEYLKDEENRENKILLITTQVVEAGVDIDMDLGFKNRSLIDSDEQLAGRINRNVNKENCELYLFNHDNAKIIYGKDSRYTETLKFDTEKIAEILNTKSFNYLYKKVFAEIFRINQSAFIEGWHTYKENFERIDFKNIHQKFKLIDSENVSLFVPLDVEIKCYKDENNFSANEIEFIKKYNCLTDENKVSGEEIWKLYVSFISDSSKKFSIDIKILNGIMSKFVFSVFMKKANDLYQFIENPPTTDDDKFQRYWKFRKEDLDKIYTEEGGINEKYLKKKTGSTFEFI